MVGQRAYGAGIRIPATTTPGRLESFPQPGLEGRRAFTGRVVHDDRCHGLRWRGRLEASKNAGLIPRDVIESPRVAVQSATPIPVERGLTSLLKLTHSDRVVRIGATKSYFKVVSLFVDSPRTVRIQVTSMCDCFGFNKYIVVPIIEIFDRNGQDVALPSPDVESEQADMSNPLRLVATWMLPFKPRGPTGS